MFLGARRKDTLRLLGCQPLGSASARKMQAAYGNTERDVRRNVVVLNQASSVAP
jgi:hypothetical protein